MPARYNVRVTVKKTGAVGVARDLETKKTIEVYYTEREVRLLARATGDNDDKIQEALAYMTQLTLKKEFQLGEFSPAVSPAADLPTLLRQAIDQAVVEEKFELAARLKKELAADAGTA